MFLFVSLNLSSKGAKKNSFQATKTTSNLLSRQRLCRIDSEVISTSKIKKPFSHKRTTKNGQKFLKNYLREIPSNQIVIVLSCFWLIETSYLFLSKMYSLGLVCNFGTCSTVLNSPFSNVFGIPYSFLSFVTNCQIFFFIGRKNFFELTATRYRNIKQIYFFDSFLIVFGFFETYFVFILEFILQENCEWCFLSILLINGMLINFLIQQNKLELINKKLTLVFAISFPLVQYLGNIIELGLILKK